MFHSWAVFYGGCKYLLDSAAVSSKGTYDFRDGL